MRADLIGEGGLAHLTRPKECASGLAGQGIFYNGQDAPGPKIRDGLLNDAVVRG